MQDHRKPPKPVHYDIIVPGQCRYCGKEILKANGKLNSRAHWHKPCVAEYQIIYWPTATRKAVWQRDKGRCETCGTTCPRRQWDMDHRKPLVEAKGDISYWRLDNCRTLCKPCHKKKTGEEATARAAARRKDSIAPGDKPAGQ